MAWEAISDLASSVAGSMLKSSNSAETKIYNPAQASKNDFGGFMMPTSNARSNSRVASNSGTKAADPNNILQNWVSIINGYEG